MVKTSELYSEQALQFIAAILISKFFLTEARGPKTEVWSKLLNVFLPSSFQLVFIQISLEI